MPTPYTSRVLYHLVGNGRPSDHEKNLSVLCLILQSMEIRTNTVGRHSGGIALSIDPYRGLLNGEPIAQTVTCFCDIPFESLGLHTTKYGQFGVGVDREIVAKWGGRPVIYIPTDRDNMGGWNNVLCREGLNAWKGVTDHFPEREEAHARVVGAPPESASESAHLAKDFISKNVLAFTKTFDVSLPDTDPMNYYMEREWRKLANLSLHLPLREIIAPSTYHASLREEFPHLSHIRFREAPSPDAAASSTCVS
jgi:hypothetical protein